MKKNLLIGALAAAGMLSAAPAFAQDQVVKLTTAAGQKVSLRVNYARQGFTVDWGDGPVSYTSAAGEDGLCLAEGVAKTGTVTLTGGSRLSTLVCSGNKLTAIDLSGATALRSLYCQDNELSKLDVTPCKQLTDLDCSGNSLSVLTVTEKTHPYVENINVTGNKLGALTGSSSGSLAIRHSNVQHIYAGGNKFTAVNVSSNKSLDLLDCTANKISTRLTLSANDSLSVLLCSDNSISGLIMPSSTGLPALTQLVADNNRLSTLDLTLSTGLSYLSCANNQLTQVGLPSGVTLDAMSCGGNKLTFSSLPSAANMPAHISYAPQDENFDISALLTKKGDYYYMVQAPSFSDRNKDAYQLDLSDYALDPDGKRTISFTFYGQNDGAEAAELTKASLTNKDGDYFPATSAANYGKFSFLKPQHAAWFEMTSTTYPDLKFVSTGFTVAPEDEITGIASVAGTGASLSVTGGAGELTLRSGAAQRVDIYDMQGRRVWQGEAAVDGTSVSLPAGVYVAGGKRVLVR